MWPAVVVLSAVRAIEIATIRDIKAALQRFAIEEALTRFQNVIPGKFTADVFENLHAIKPSQTPQCSDNLSRRKKGTVRESLDPPRLVDFSQFLSREYFAER
jgi:hypothetical protein